MALARERLVYDGDTYQLPLPDGPGKPLKLMIAPVQERMPIYIAAIGPKNTQLTGEIADGWLPTFFSPEHVGEAVELLNEGARRGGKDAIADDFDIAPTVNVSIGDDLAAARDTIRPMLALYVGGMGSREKNFYNQLVQRYGFEENAKKVQDLYLDGKKDEAAAALSDDLIDHVALVGPKDRVKDRLDAYRDAGVFVDALHPIIGPIVRKSVAETLRRLLQSFNQTLEHTFSWRGLKWRWEALRTGRSFAEVVMLRSLVYRVEQLFLIHRETSLSLLHVTSDPALSKDSDMVAGMLSAIQDFARDSFATGEDAALEEFRVGELQVWIVPGRHAYLAAVIRGNPSLELRPALEETIETVHVLKGSALAEFAGDASAFESLRPELELALRAQYARTKKEGKSTRAWIVIMLIAALATAGSDSRAAKPFKVEGFPPPAQGAARSGRDRSAKRMVWAGGSAGIARRFGARSGDDCARGKARSESDRFSVE